jgi:hypothetical protein
MSAYQRLRSYHRSVAAFLLLLWLPACANWQVPGVAPTTYIEEQHPDRVRVTTDTSRVQLDRPFVRADTIVGTRWVASRAGLMRMDTVQVAVQQVTRLEIEGSNTGTVLVVVGGLLLALAIIGGVGMSDAMDFSK